MFGIANFNARKLKGSAYEVWPEHEYALDTFIRCSSQWRAGSGGILGLDYNVVLKVMVLYDVPNPAAVLDEIRVIESRAVELLNQKTKG
jgi:hypothetical protein